MFVKNHIHEFDHLPKQTDRMRAVAALYRKQKGMPSKPKAMKSQKAKKAQKGGGLLMDMLSPNPLSHLLGGELKKGRGRPSKAMSAMPAMPKRGKAKGGSVTGAGWFDDFSKGFMLPFQAVASVAPLLV